MKLLLNFILLLACVNAQDDAEVEDLELNTNHDNTFLAITLDEVSSILHTNTEDGNEFLQNLLVQFPKVLVSFDWNAENTVSFATLASFLKKTCLPKSFADSTNTTQMDIWLSFSPQDGIYTQVTSVLDATRHAECPTQKTVFKLLLYYPGPQITKVTIPLVRQDVIKTSRVLNYLLATVGVMFDLQTLQQNENLEILKTLPLNLMDTIMFKATETTHLRPETVSDVMLYSFEDFERYREKVLDQLVGLKHLGLLTYWPAIKNVNNSQSPISYEDESILATQLFWHAYNNLSVAIMPFVLANDSGQFVSTSIFSTTSDHQENLTLHFEWLRAPTGFNQKYLGTSVAVGVIQEDVQSYMTKIFLVFRNVIIDSLNGLSYSGNTDLLEICEQIANLKSDFVRKITNMGGWANLEDHVPIQAFLSVNLSTKSDNVNKGMIDQASEAAHGGNLMYPGTFTGILLDFHLKLNQLLNGNYTSFTLIEGDWFKPFSDLINYAVEKTKFNSEQALLNVGIIMPIKACEIFATYNPIITQLVSVHPIVFQADISYWSITNDLPNTISKTVSNFQRCKRNFIIYEEGWQKLSLEFRVRVDHCVEIDKFSSVGKYVHFWEEFNIWATQTKTTIIMGKALDSQKQESFCGWWNVSKGNSSDSLHKYAFEDKKTLALRLYKEAHPVNPRANLVSSSTTDVAMLLIILIPVIIAVVLVSVFVSVLMMRYRSKYLLSKEDAQNFFKGDNHARGLAGEADGNATAESQPYDRERYEISKDHFVLDSTKVLGIGEFGMVLHGYLKPPSQPQTPVAVKLNNTKHYTSLKGLLSEIKVLAFLGNHPNIVALMGANTADMRMGKVLVFLELCELGSLEKYLRSFNPEVCTKPGLIDTQESSSSGSSRQYENVQNKYILDDQLSRDIYKWSGDIANGMEYLSSKQVVHADLATRNVLLSATKHAKLADFGLSRRLYDYTNYVKQHQEPLPWRWMAPESLRRLEFNEKTDVWAFGVLLWELYTLGDQPYPGLSWDVKFPDCLECGLRLSEPRYNEKGMYQLMMRCWSFSPKDRPSFFELSVMLNQNSENGGVSDNNGPEEKRKVQNNYV